MDVRRTLISALTFGALSTSMAFAHELGPIEDYQQGMTNAVSASPLAPNVQTFVNSNLLAVMTNPVFVAELKKQNALGRTLDEIKAIDGQWKNAEEEMPIMIEQMTNASAAEISKVFKPISQVGEVFLMDNQGANVGLNALTSDFWQGDEAKWELSFNKGKGGLYVGEAELDKSTNEVLQQISLPIIDKDGTVLGAICIGIRVNAF